MFSFAEMYSAISLCTSRVVRRKVRHHRDVRRALHIKELERRELDDREILGPHLLRVAQQRVADVAAEIHGLPRRAQHFGDDARRGGLAVAARHADDRAWADLEKDLHFRRYDAAARSSPRAAPARPAACPACGRRRPRADRRGSPRQGASCAPSASSCSARSLKSSRLFLSQAMTCTPFRHNSSMSGVLLTPMPSTAAVFPRREDRYSCIVIDVRPFICTYKISI